MRKRWRAWIAFLEKYGLEAIYGQRRGMLARLFRNYLLFASAIYKALVKIRGCLK